MNSIMDILYIPFGYVMKLCCMISFNNYVIALLFFAIIMQVVLFPLGIKQQKSQITMAKLRPKEMAIRKKYAGRTDRPTQQKMNMEIQQLYSSEGYNPLSGCLPLLIQLPIIIALFAVVRNPITYTVNLGGSGVETANLYNDAINMTEEAKSRLPADSSDSEISAYRSDLVELQKMFGASVDDAGNITDRGEPTDSSNAEFALVQMITTGSETINEFLTSKGLEPINDTFSTEIKEKMPNFDLFGDTSALQTPTLSFNLLLLIPILVFVSSYFSGVLIRKFSAPAPDMNGQAVGNGMFLKVGMPLISAVFAFSFPAAIGIYWIFRTVVSVGQQFILSKMYPVPKFTEADFAAAEKELRKSAKKKKVIMIEVDEDDDSYKDIEVKDGSSAGGKRIEMLKSDDADAGDGKKPSEDAGRVEKAPMKEDNPPPEKTDKENKE